MQNIRGTLILADQVYRTRDDKWVIAGTYNSWSTPGKRLQIHGFRVYLRIQVDTPGIYPCRVLLIDRIMPPTVPPIQELQFDAPIASPLSPFEAALCLPELEVKCPVCLLYTSPSPRD